MTTTHAYHAHFFCYHAQMLSPSTLHTSVNIPLLVQTSLPSDAMGMSHSCSTADIPQLPLVEYLMLLEFAAKGKLLEVSDIM